MEPMARSSDQLGHERLFEAAEAVLEAIVEVSKQTRGVCAHPTELRGSAHQPACLRDFSRSEIEQATSFLVRLGLLSVHRS